MVATVFPAINLLAVVVAAIAFWVVGGILSAPPLLGNTYVKLLGKTRKEMMKPSKLAGLFLLTLITTFVLAVFIGYAGAKTPLDGAIIGLWAWFGFMLTTAAGSVLFEGKPTKLGAAFASSGFVSFLVAGAILGAWP